MSVSSFKPHIHLAWHIGNQTEKYVEKNNQITSVLYPPTSFVRGDETRGGVKKKEGRKGKGNLFHDSNYHKQNERPYKRAFQSLETSPSWEHVSCPSSVLIALSAISPPPCSSRISPLSFVSLVLSLPSTSHLWLLWPPWLSPSCLCSSFIPPFYFGNPFRALLCSPHHLCDLSGLCSFSYNPSLWFFSEISLPFLAFSAFFRTQKTSKDSEINFSLDKHPNLGLLPPILYWKSLDLKSHWEGWPYKSSRT